ncbi:MAG: hypothetical protein HFH12_07915 [Dorea sp.]|nr:hypothetical protein [Dorea sp.]
MDYSLFRMDEKEWENIRSGLTETKDGWKTPFYLFSEGKAKKNVGILKDSMGGKVQIAYALKANPWLIREMAVSADFIEVCSEGELEICRKNKVPGDKIVVDGVYKNDNFIKKALEMDISRICVVSLEQLEKIMYFSEGRGIPHILLRVSSGNQFGMEEQEAAECIQMCRGRHRTEEAGIGIQFYPGTQRSNIQQIQEELKKLKQWLNFFELKTDVKLKIIEFGSGIGVPYFESDDTEDYAKAWEIVSDFAEQISKNYTVTYESGRIISAACGIYVTKVFARKTNGEKEILFCDGGTNHLVYHGGILGVRTPYAKSVCNNPSGRSGQFMVCGPLCSEGDVLIRDCWILDENTAEGDYIVFFNAGAYSATESANLFLSMAMPAVLLYNKNNSFVQEIRGHISTYKLIQDGM